MASSENMEIIEIKSVEGLESIEVVVGS